MLNDTRVVFLVLLCLILVGSGCNAVKSQDTTAQPTLKPHQGLSPPQPTVIDRGLLHGEPCNPPCWEGITPGISSKEDVVHIFDQLQLEGRIISYTLWNYRAEWASGATYVTFDGEHVGDLQIHYDYLRGFDYRVKQIIERFGEPEAYAVFTDFERDNCPCDNWDDFEIYAHPSSSGYFLYPSQGVTVLVKIPDGYTGCVCPEMKTAAFYYYQPRSLTNALQESNSPAFGWADWSGEHIVTWHGYGPGY
jgi:hypothetical protein